MLKFFVSCSVLLFGAFAVSFGAPTVHAADPEAGAKTKTQVIQRPVTWSMTPAQCSNLSIEVDAKGKWYEVITTTTYSDGKQRVIDDSFAQGTATDANGGKYIFIYGNNNISSIPVGGSPVQIDMSDVFVLNQTNGNNDLRAAFKWKWTYNPPDPNWPPSTNWKQIYTIGDPLHCDPI